MTQKTKNAPAFVFRDGPLRVAAFRNAKRTGDGEFWSVTISRTYKAADGTFRDTSRFSPMELLAISRMADFAYQEILVAEGRHPDPDAAV